MEFELDKGKVLPVKGTSSLEKELELISLIADNSCLRDLNEYVIKNDINNFIDETELYEVIRHLNKVKKNNVLLIGKAGVGKTAMVEAVCKAINNNNVPDFLKGKTIVEMSLGGAIAGTKYRGEFEEKIQDILNFISERNDVILFIDEIHNLMNCGGNEGSISAGDMLKPYMARNDIMVIGATTLEEYKKSIKRNSAMNRRFSKVLIKEPKVSKTIQILESSKELYEKHYNVKLDTKEIRNVVLLAKRRKGTFPDKAFDELEAYCFGKQERQKQVNDALNIKPLKVGDS